MSNYPDGMNDKALDGICGECEERIMESDLIQMYGERMFEDLINWAKVRGYDYDNDCIEAMKDNYMDAFYDFMKGLNKESVECCGEEIEI